jgi:hypothetical protein
VLQSVSRVGVQLGVEDKPVVMAESGDPRRVDLESTGSTNVID